jgi:hypothetical protein
VAWLERVEKDLAYTAPEVGIKLTCSVGTAGHEVYDFRSRTPAGKLPRAELVAWLERVEKDLAYTAPEVGITLTCSVGTVRKAGHEVYDFRSPAPSDHGFSWRR